MPNWIDFRVLPKIFQKIFSAIFGPFSLLSHFFDLSKLKIYLKTSIFIQRKILEARFSPPNSTFSPQLPPPTFSNFVVFRTYVTQFKWAQQIPFFFNFHITIRNHKNNDFWYNLPNRIYFLYKTWKYFQQFSAVFRWEKFFFDLSILKIVWKRSIFIKRKFL